MAHVRFIIKSQPGAITIPNYERALSNWYGTVKEVDFALSGKKNGSLEWRITKLSAAQDLVMEAESRSLIRDMDFGEPVLSANIRGLRQLETEGSTPPYLRETGMKKIENLVNMIGRTGATGFAIENSSNKAELSTIALANTKALLRPVSIYFGSVEGKLETLSVHKRDKFIVYHSITNKAVNCYLEDDEVRSTASLLGERVLVYGEITVNGKGEPMSVKVSSLRRLRKDSELPTIEEMTGSDPDLLAGISLAEHLGGVPIG